MPGPSRYSPGRPPAIKGLEPEAVQALAQYLLGEARRISDELQRQSRPDAVIPLQQDRLQAAAGQFLRVSPPAEGMVLTLPAPDPTNMGERNAVTVFIELPYGPLDVAATPKVNPDRSVTAATVNGAAMARFTVAGVVRFFSNGLDQWQSTSSLPIAVDEQGNVAIPTPGPTGATGATGPQGAKGATGPSGLDGQAGADGADGFPGATGAQGIQGLMGFWPNDGVDGADGFPGAQGSTGPQGPQGATGATGATGTTGATGATGGAGVIAGSFSGSVAIPYTFSTTTTNSDPGNGVMRLDNATQNLSTVLRLDLLSNLGDDVELDLKVMGEPEGTGQLGYITLINTANRSQFLVFRLTSISLAVGYYNFTAVNVDSSAASPFANAASLLLLFTPIAPTPTVLRRFALSHSGTTTLSGGDTTAFAWNYETVVQAFTSSDGSGLTGIAAPAGWGVFDLNEFPFIIIWNRGTANALPLRHESVTETTAANRFNCPHSVDYFIPPSCFVAAFKDTTLNRWFVLGNSFNAGQVPANSIVCNPTAAAATARQTVALGTEEVLLRLNGNLVNVALGSLAGAGVAWSASNDRFELVACTQAEQETATATATGAVTPGRQQFHPSACKAWGSISGTATTVFASYNVTSQAHTATGVTTVTIATDFSSANWAPVVSSASAANLARISYIDTAATTVTLFVIRTVRASSTAADTGVAVDPSALTFACFGDQ